MAPVILRMNLQGSSMPLLFSRGLWLTCGTWTLRGNVRVNITKLTLFEQTPQPLIIHILYSKHTDVNAVKLLVFSRLPS